MAILTGSVFKEDYKVKIVTFYSDEIELDTNVERINLNIPSKSGKIGKITQAIKRIMALNRLRKDFMPDAVISFGPTANIVNAFSKHIGRTVISFHGLCDMGQTIITRFCCKKADRIYCVSKQMYSILKHTLSKYEKKLTVVYNGCNLEEIRAKSKTEKRFFPCPTIVTIGRLERVKGLRHLLNAFKLVAESNENVCLAIIGDGTQRAELEHQAVDLGISERVLFLGYQTNPYCYLAQAKICVQTSLSEGFMISLVEAAACGVPAISTDCTAGPREILSGDFCQGPTEQIEYAQYGILVPSFADEEEDDPYRESLLAEAIKVLLSNEDLYAQYKEKLAECAKRFSIERYRQQIFNLVVSP